MRKHWMAPDGSYLGVSVGREDGKSLPEKPREDAIEIPTPPPHGLCVWDGRKWSDPPAEEIADLEARRP